MYFSRNVRLYIKKKDENIEDENTTDLYEFIIYDNGQGCSDLKNSDYLISN